MLVLLAASLILVPGCGRDELVELSRFQSPVAVAVQSVEFQRESRRTFTCYGRVEPPRQLQLRSPVNLALKQIRSPGEQVKKGEILAQFDVSSLQQRKSGLQKALTQNSVPQERSQLMAQLQELNRQIDAATVVAPFDVIVKSSAVIASGTVEQDRIIMHIVENGLARISTRVPIWVKEQTSEDSLFWIYLDEQPLMCTLDYGTNDESSFASRRLFLTAHPEDLSASRSQEYFQAVRIRFEFPRNSRGFWVPTTALISENAGDWRLFAVETREAQNGVRSVAVRKRVTVLGFEGPNAFVDGSLEPGALFVSRGKQRLVSGQTICYSEPESLGAFNGQLPGEE